MSNSNQNIADKVKMETQKLPLDYQEAVLAHVQYLGAAIQKDLRRIALKDTLNFIE